MSTPEQRAAAAVHWKEADRIWKTVISMADQFNRTHSQHCFDQWQAAIADHKAECDKASRIDPDWRLTACEEYPA